MAKLLRSIFSFLCFLIPIISFAGGGGGDCTGGTALSCGVTVSTVTGACIGCEPVNANNGGACCWVGADINCDGTQDVEYSIEDSKGFTYTVPAGIACGSTYTITVTTTANIQGTVYNVTQGGGINYGHAATDTWASAFMGGGNFTLTTNACAGDIIQINIDGYAGTIGNFDIAITCPPPCTPATLSNVNTNASCGVCNGVINLTAAGGTAPYTYLWNTGQTTEDRSSLCVGTYTVTVSATGGCTSTRSIAMVNTGAPTLSSVVTNAICGANGSINLTVSGGTTPYTYNWSTGSSTEDISGRSAGTYTVTVVDAASCRSILTSVIVDAGTPTITLANQTDPSCFGVNSGAIDITVTGGVTPYTYSWTGGTTTQDISSLAAGTYTVTVTTASPCTRTASYTLSAPPPAMTVTSTVTGTCSGQSTGGINITPSNGTPSYTYVWSTGASTEDVTGLAVGTYTVTVYDSKSCTATYSVAVGVSAFTVNAGSDVTICPYTASTVLSGSYSNAQLNYTNTTYTGTGGAIPDVTTTNFTNVSATSGGIITSVCLDISIIWNEDLDISLVCPGGTTIDLSSDNGGSGDDYTNVCFNRTATTNVNTYSGVNSNITGNFLPEQALSGLDGCASNGTWTLRITDDLMFVSGTLNSWSYVVSVPIPPVISWSPATNLSATNVLNPTFTNPGPGTYTYTLSVTDAVCTLTDQVVITVAGPSLSRTLSNPTCGLTNGSINLTVSGGTAPFTFAWSNAATTEDISSLGSGTYTVTVTDAATCTATINGTLTAPGTPIISLVTQTNVTCPGGNDGALNISVAGGTTPYTYVWSNAATTQDITALVANTYTVTVTENGGCTATASYIITQPAAWSVTNVTTNVVCPCDATGGVNITVVAGGTPGYTYLWSNATTTEDIAGVVDGTYTVTITDSKSCTRSQSYAITEPAQITIALNSQTNLSCFGVCIGSATIQASGGASPYDFSNDGGGSWQFTNVAAAVTYSSLCAGSYTYTVRDANGCLTH